MPFAPGELNAIGEHTANLNFYGRDLSSNEIIRLYERLVENAPGLQRLNLSENSQLDLERLQQRFGQLPVGNNLLELRLDGCNIGEEGENILAQVIQHNPNLERLSLNENNLTETIANQLREALEGQYRLVELNLNNNFDNEHDPIEQATLDAIEALLQRNRDLHEQQQAEQKNKNDQQGPGGGAGGNDEKDNEGSGKRKRGDDDDRDGDRSKKEAKTTRATPSSSTQGKGAVSNLVNQSHGQGGGITV